MADDSPLSPFRQAHPEDPSKEIEPPKETETIHPNQEKENMEVHAHELHKAPGHGWKHYFFEFFMLFLAVFCGFLAENLQFLFDESVSIRRSLREKLQPLLNAADFAKIVDSTNAIINPSDVLHLRSADPNTINSCLLEVNNIRGLSIGTKQRIQALRDRTGRIKNYIKEEYKLD